MDTEWQTETGMSVLAIHGSPRRGGNTDILLNRAMEGAVQVGARVEHLYVSRLNISPCIGCGGCEETGQCVLEDDMQRIYPLLEGSHRVVLATPVYFYGVTAQLKALIDRCQALWSRKFLIDDPLPRQIRGIERKGFVLSVAASSGKRVFEGVLLTAQIFFDALNVTSGGKMLLRGLDEKGAITGRKKAMEEAFEMGRALGRTTSP